jgi:LysR family transcriptional regulator, hydrogen peroxide-inducible genes activator
MDLDQLANFLKVAETGNFTHAAEQLGMSQPAISRSIQRLESEIGQPLLERKSRGVALTDAGLLLQSRARQVFTILDDTRLEISDDGHTGRVRLAAIPTIAPYFLPGLLQKFAEKFPDAHVTVQEDTTDHLIKRLTQGEVDLAILALPINAKYVDIEPLFDEELLLILSINHPLSQKKQIKIDDIEPFAFVMLDEAHCLSDNINSFCRQRSFQPVAMEYTSQLATVQELVALNHGISLVPQMAKAIDESKRREYRSLAGAKPMRTIAACWNPYRFQSKLLVEFRKTLRTFSSQHVKRITKTES